MTWLARPLRSSCKIRRGCRAALAGHPRRPFTVLALESSADDTCAAVVTSCKRILSNVVLKQHHLHEGFGGIHPLIAVRAHQLGMPHAIRQALADAHLTMGDIDGVAFTRGPGMNGGLGVCSTAAKALAAALGKPLVGVHHMRAHALTPFLTSTSPAALPSFPFLTLLVSGGHTLLVLATGPAAFRTLATTVDESIGRAFDKVARLLGLEWAPSLGPGAALERFCAEDGEDGVAGDDQQLHVPPLSVMPSVLPGKLAFSYAGLHSIVERYVTGWQQQHNKQQREHAAESATTLPTRTRRALGRAFQTAAVAQLEEKLLLALELCAREHVAVRHVVVSGGVASNNFLRQRLHEAVQIAFSPDTPPISLVFPPAELCTDNAVMIAWASMDRFLARDYDDISIDVLPKWDIGDLNGSK